MSETTPNKIPRHIGYIVDGNRRWAKERGLKPYEGHEAGYEVIREVLIDTLNRGVQYASAYVFSTENWKRSPIEVKKLMELLQRVLVDELPTFHEHQVRVRVIGERAKPLPAGILKAIENVEQETDQYGGKELIVCLNYGGQQEIVEACKKIVQSGMDPKNITVETLAAELYVPDVPPCDLIVRTSGEQRLSNFMLWRAAYSELMFIEKTWPDMTKQDVTDILDEYAKRNRRFGG